MMSNMCRERMHHPIREQTLSCRGKTRDMIRLEKKKGMIETDRLLKHHLTNP